MEPPRLRFESGSRVGNFELMSDSEINKTFFSQQIEELLDTLYAAALRLTQQSADAEDLVAGSVEKAWRCIDTLADQSRFRPWIFQIMRNHFISGFRRRSARPPELGLDDLFEDEGGVDLASYLMEQSDDFLNWWASPEKEFVNQLLRTEIMEAINRLPMPYRVVILLINVEGFGYDEAAEVLGIPTGTVRSRMKRGRTLLQKSLWRQAREAGLINEGERRGIADECQR